MVFNLIKTTKLIHTDLSFYHLIMLIVYSVILISQILAVYTIQCLLHISMSNYKRLYVPMQMLPHFFHVTKCTCSIFYSTLRKHWNKHVFSAADAHSNYLRARRLMVKILCCNVFAIFLFLIKLKCNNV